MELKSAELRFEYTFPDGSRKYEDLFVAADALNEWATKLDTFQGKYEGEFFKDKCCKVVTLSQELEDIKKQQKDLKSKEVVVKANLNELTKDFESGGCKGIKPVLVKLHQLSDTAYTLMKLSGINSEEFPVLYQIVKGQ